MLQNGGTDTLYSVSELWEGSVLHNPGLPAGPEPLQIGNGIFSWILIALIVMALVFRDVLKSFNVWLANFIYSPDQRNFTDMALPRLFFPVIFLVFIPVSAFMVYGLGLVRTEYYVILSVLAGYFVLKALVLSCISYVTGEKGLVLSLVKMMAVALFIFTQIAILLYAAGMFFPQFLPEILLKVSPVVGGALFILYLIQLSRIFFSFGEPPLLSILYLCTFEMLPAGLAMATIIKF